MPFRIKDGNAGLISLAGTFSFTTEMAAAITRTIVGVGDFSFSASMNGSPSIPGGGPTLSWSRPTELDGTAIPDADITGYEIWQKSGTDQTLVDSVTGPNNTSYDLGQLSAGTYQLMVYVEWNDGSIDPLFREFVEVTI